MITKTKVAFTSRELCDRYDVCLRTIQAWQRTKGYPQGDFNSKTYLFSVAKVIAWEKLHMPHLHEVPQNVEEEPEQAAAWAKLRSQRDRDREEEPVRMVAKKSKGRR